MLVLLRIRRIPKYPTQPVLWTAMQDDVSKKSVVDPDPVGSALLLLDTDRHRNSRPADSDRIRICTVYIFF